MNSRKIFHDEDDDNNNIKILEETLIFIHNFFKILGYLISKGRSNPLYKPLLKAASPPWLPYYLVAENIHVFIFVQNKKRRKAECLINTINPAYTKLRDRST